MESDCRISVKSVVFYMLLWSWLCLRVYCAPGLSKASTSMMEAMATPCWQVEEFVVSAECFQCNTFQQKLWRECSSTGYVEKINCTKSNKDEYKRETPAMSAVWNPHPIHRGSLFFNPTLTLAVLSSRSR
ncbi:uncharacterized protein LOC108941916 isoform X2 [Scleropages formosus]|uniref:uncharacterized protein LOC108941916 isoform X2 n=1 Tax=Scleropages formosus TaxID=113540 RepID=UPI000878ACCF|nr:uncharacterized protein LOC108941916 isoform X2 [Scleropages formosus]